MTIRATLLFLFTLMFAINAVADENLKTPYVMLDPSTIPSPSAMAILVPLGLLPPGSGPEDPLVFELPTANSFAETTDGSELITISNSETALAVRIDEDRRVVIQSLKSNRNGYEFLAQPSRVFDSPEGETRSSDSYRVAHWRGAQYPEFAEFTAELQADEAQGTQPQQIVWRVRAHRTRAYIEQQFETTGSRVVLGQVLQTKASLKPVMPANLFGRGFRDGKPNIIDRRRFEYTEESEHMCYDAQEHTGVWGFVTDTGGQERMASGRFTLIQTINLQNSNSSSSGRFIIQPFYGSPEVGFAGLRNFIQQDYSIQKFAPPVFEWNQFWLWMGGPVNVGYEVVTEARLFDVLPLIVKLGLEEFHLDAGWQRGPGDWVLDPKRFSGGWDRIREFNRRNGLAFHLWVNDPQSNSAEFLLDLVEKSGLNRLFIDRCVTDETLVALDKVRSVHPGLSINVHNSTSPSVGWPWGNLHFLSHLNQIYFGEGEFWAWSSILPETSDRSEPDPAYPQLQEAERFFSKHDMATGDLITRAAAYQAHWVWPFNAVMPPHSSWDWFEKRPIEQLKHRAFTYLACKWKYEWGFDPRRLSPEAIRFHQQLTAWFKVNRDYLTVYQHVLDPPDGISVDAAGHVIQGKGYVFVFNPSEREQEVEWKQILWEAELNLLPGEVSLSDWTALSSFEQLPPQDLVQPTGSLKIGAGGVRLIGINLECPAILAGVRGELKKLRH